MNVQEIVDFMWKNISEASAALQKGITFYLAILAATTGYIFSANISDEKKFAVFIVALLISFFAAVSGAALGGGIWLGLKDIELAVSKGESNQAKNIYIKFIRRGRIVGIVIIVCMAGVLLTLLGSLVYAGV